MSFLQGMGKLPMVPRSRSKIAKARRKFWDQESKIQLKGAAIEGMGSGMGLALGAALAAIILRATTGGARLS